MGLKNLIIHHSSDTGFGSKISREIYDLLDGDTIIRSAPQIISDLDKLEIEILIKEHSRIVFVMPEFNGSFPSAFKQIVDSSGWPSAFENKPMYLVGFSGGWSRNIMGVNHMKYILDYVKADTYKESAYFTIIGNEEIDNTKNWNILISQVEKWNLKTQNKK